MKIGNLKIGTRLGIGFAAVLALTALMTVTGVLQLHRVGQAKNKMVEASYKRQLAEEWLRGIATNSVRTFARAKSNDADDQRYFQDEMTTTSKRVSEIQKELTELIESSEGKRLLSDVGEKRKFYSGIRDKVFELKKAGQDEAEVKALVDTKMVPAMNAYTQSIQEVVDYQNLLFKEANATIDAIYESSRNLLIALGVAAVALGAILAWLLSRSILKPVSNAVAIARTVAAGDLSSKIEVKSQDEIGQLLTALKDMNDSLFKTIIEVRSGTDTIATASRQIAAGNQDLSSRTEQQASSLEETASSMEELTSTVKQNADNARQANHLAVSASDVAIKGGSVVAEVVETMGSINASSKKIVDIISVIDGIAFQTNILALNAAVEAARAGEQGRGFAVVASEVRNLAQRSASAAKEIKALIDDSVSKVDAGSKLVGEAGSTMDAIVDSVKRVTDIMAEIMAASQEQSAGIEQVNQAIAQMDQVTQQNASLVEEAAAAAESMQDQASSLAQAVSVFKLDDKQAAAAPLAAREPNLSRAKQSATPVVKRASVKARIAVAAPQPKHIANTRPTTGGDWEEF